MTSVTISTTTVTYDTDTGNGSGGGNYGNYGQSQRPRDDSYDIGGQGGHNAGNGSMDAVLANMNIPDAFKDLLRKILAGSDGASLPSEASAVDTMQKFQNANKDKLGLISYDQMKDIASGKIDQINGVKIPDDVKEAAKTYVANNGALFDKVECAFNGKHDSQLSATDADCVDRSKLSTQPTVAGTSPDSFLRACAHGHISPDEPDEYDAVKTMGKFQKDNDIKLISYDDMKKIASGEMTEMNGKAIPPEVKDAAKAYVANNGALFDKIESATDGKHDSQLSAGDADQGVKKGLVNVPPLSEKGAVAAMEDFQKNGGPKHISYDQMQDIASGKITSMNGKEITPEVKAAAQAYVANNGALFDKIESATDGKHDSRLGSGDPEQARNKGIVLSDQAPLANNGATPYQGNQQGNYQGNPQGNYQNYGAGNYGQPGNGQPSGTGQSAAAETKAVETMEKFQKNGGPKLISFDQMQDIASGKITSMNGKEITPEVKAAAQAYVANNGALFDKLEASTDGKHDSKLGAGDPAHARTNGTVGMSDSKAVDTIASLQEDGFAMFAHNMKPGSTISADQMQEMATKGTLNGVAVSADQQNAARAYMANNGALFDKVEAATNGEHDSRLSAGDAKQAHDKGLLPA